MNKELLEKILADGVTAPSGENCQPWRFVISSEEVFIFNVPEADTSLYNFEQRGSFVAHGALIETICISAKKHGFTPTVKLFPEGERSNCTSRISFVPAPKIDDSLYDMIVKRCTNRRDYKATPLQEGHKKILENSLASSSLILVEEKEKKDILGEMLARHEKVLFENKYLHDFFYNHIIWNKEDEEKSGGFFIETLEFLPHQRKGVILFKNWTILKILNKILNVSSAISKENTIKYATSPAIGALLMEGDSFEAYIRLGMDMQRVWLTATELGLAMHPCNGTLYLIEFIRNKGGVEFSKSQRDYILESERHLHAHFNVINNAKIGFIFRIGEADSPTACAKRLPPVIEYK